jgi:hypothetical protein
MALHPNTLAEEHPTPASSVPSAETPHRLMEAPPQVATAVFADKGPQDNIGGSTYSLGPQMFDPTVAASGGGRSWANNITAFAGGGRPNAVKLRAAINRIATCATAADSVSLPPAVGGQVVYVVNNGAASCQVFADTATADTINGVAAATGVALAAAKSASYASPAPGVWFMVLSA